MSGTAGIATMFNVFNTLLGAPQIQGKVSFGK